MKLYLFWCFEESQLSIILQNPIFGANTLFLIDLFEPPYCPRSVYRRFVNAQFLNQLEYIQWNNIMVIISPYWLIACGVSS